MEQVRNIHFFLFFFSYNTRACLKNHSCNLHAPLCGIFCLHSVDVARYAALIQTKSPTNCDIYLAESIFQTHSRVCLTERKITRIVFVSPDTIHGVYNNNRKN